MVDQVLFDLDGTLTASDPGIVRCAEYALRQLGKAVPPREELLKFVGPPLFDAFEQVAGLAPEEIEPAIQYYRERYSVTGIFECTLYPGLQELLAAVQQAGLGIHLATSKPILFANRILEHFDLLHFFTSTEGVPMDADKHTKADVIARVLQKNHLPAESAVMVGDRFYDAEGAAACGLAFIGVTYGYGSRQELEEAGAALLAPDLPTLQRMLLSRGRSE